MIKTAGSKLPAVRRKDKEMARKDTVLTEETAKEAALTEAAENSQESEETKEEMEKRLSREAEKHAHEMVTIRLAFDKEHTEPLTVSVNGKTWLIKRGEEVVVPRFIKDVLDNSEKQDMLLYQIIQANEDDVRELSS